MQPPDRASIGAARSDVVSVLDRDVLAAAAAAQGLVPERALGFALALQRRLAQPAFYVFRTNGSGGSSGSSLRTRLVAAFANADAALAFAQCNVPAARPRVRALSIEQLLAVVLQEPAIRALLFIPDSPEPLAHGRLPEGLRIQREALVRALRADASTARPDTPLLERN